MCLSNDYLFEMFLSNDHLRTVVHKFLLIFFTGNDHLRNVFVKTMGLSDKDIVTLSGGHTLVYTGLSLNILPTIAH